MKRIVLRTMTTTMTEVVNTTNRKRKRTTRNIADAVTITVRSVHD